MIDFNNKQTVRQFEVVASDGRKRVYEISSIVGFTVNDPMFKKTMDDMEQSVREAAKEEMDKEIVGAVIFGYQKKGSRDLMVDVRTMTGKGKSKLLEIFARECPDCLKENMRDIFNSKFEQMTKGAEMFLKIKKQGKRARWLRNNTDKWHFTELAA